MSMYSDSDGSLPTHLYMYVYILVCRHLLSEGLSKALKLLLYLARRTPQLVSRMHMRGCARSAAAARCRPRASCSTRCCSASCCYIHT